MHEHFSKLSISSTMAHVLLQLFQHLQYKSTRGKSFSFTYSCKNTRYCSSSASIIIQKQKDLTEPAKRIACLYNIRQVCVDLFSKLFYTIHLHILTSASLFFGGFFLDPRNNLCLIVVYHKAFSMTQLAFNNEEALDHF